MMDKKLLGAWGESLAAADYRKDGYEVAAANYRTRQGEIDLVVHKGGQYVFVEVKTRTAGAIDAPRAFVTKAKQQRVLLAAQSFLQAHGLTEAAVRLDVAEVWVDSAGNPSVNRIENAFEA